MNIVSSNCAGVFSGLLAQLSWMEVSEKNDDIQLVLHTRNKTHYPGSSYSNYNWFHSSDCNNMEEIVEENILFDFFQPNEYLTKNYFEKYEYHETYPADIKDRISIYPIDNLKYDGRGNDKNVYLDLESLIKTRTALNRQWNKFSFSDKFQKYVDEEEKLISGKKVICVMLRCSHHYNFKFNVLETAIQKVKDKIDNYDAVLLTTVVQPFVDRFSEEFGDKLIVANRTRYSTDIDWKGGRGGNIAPQESLTDDEYHDEYRDALLDVLLSSKCDLIIGASSNMFLAALCMNPQVQFETFYDENGS